MSLSRPLVAFLGVGILGIAGVGLGAGATFTDKITSVETIKAGSINVQLTSSTAGAVVSNNGKTITFASFGPTTSTFKTPPGLVTMTNIGTIPANGTRLNATVAYPAPRTPASSKLLAQLYVCIYSPTSKSVIYDAAVSTLVGMTAQRSGQPDLSGTTIPVNGVDDYTTEFYAGTVTTNCGLSTAPAEGLMGTAMNGAVTPSLTVSIGE